MEISIANQNRMTEMMGIAGADVPAMETQTPVGSPALVVTQTAADGTTPLTEAQEALAMDRHDGLGGLMDKAFPLKAMSKEDVLSAIMEGEYKSQKAIIDNLKPSEREIEMRKEHAKRLRELQDELKQGKKNYEEAKAQFESMFASGDPEFKALLDKVSINA